MKSNLSALGIPMVTAVTCNSLNSAMKRHMFNNQESYTVFVLCAYDDNDDAHYFYLTRDTTEEQIQAMPFFFPNSIRQKGKALYAEISNLHIETIPPDKEKRDDSHKKIIQTAYRTYRLKTAVMIESGIPYTVGSELFNQYKPIVLEESTDPKNSRAVYTQMFKECAIYSFQNLDDRISCTVKRQLDEKAAWGYSFDVKLCYENTDYHALHDDVREAIKRQFHMSNDSEAANLFEISTLMVDLNTLSAKSIPAIEGLTEETYPQIAAAIRDYIKATQENTMRLCHTIKPSQSNYYNYLFKPTDYIFTVSKHSSNNPGLYTLNYLISLNNKAPQVKAIEWDWLTESEAGQGAGGVMAINRDVIFGSFNEYVRTNILSGLRKQVNASMKSSTCSFSYCSSYVQDESTDKSAFRYDSSKGVYVWDGYSHSSKSSQATCWIPPFFAATGQLAFTYTVNCTAKVGTVKVNAVTYPAIIYDINIVLWADIIYDSGHSKGNIFNETLTAAIGFAVDAYGGVTLKKSASIKNNGTTMNKSGWSEFASFGGIDSCIDSITAHCSKWTSDTAQYIEDQFMHNFLCCSNWIMPGSKTFSFRKECFSDGQDFCSEITYTAQ